MSVTVITSIQFVQSDWIAVKFVPGFTVLNNSLLHYIYVYLSPLPYFSISSHSSSSLFFLLFSSLPQPYSFIPHFSRSLSSQLYTLLFLLMTPYCHCMFLHLPFLLCFPFPHILPSHSCSFSSTLLCCPPFLFILPAFDFLWTLPLTPTTCPLLGKADLHCEATAAGQQLSRGGQCKSQEEDEISGAGYHISIR